MNRVVEKNRNENDVWKKTDFMGCVFSYVCDVFGLYFVSLINAKNGTDRRNLLIDKLNNI